jgi:hypothetical protein
MEISFVVMNRMPCLDEAEDAASVVSAARAV